MPNIKVSASLKIPRYYKGHWGMDGSGKWVPFATLSCDSEDMNGNNRLDVQDGEDANDDGLLETLWHGGAALLSPMGRTLRISRASPTSICSTEPTIRHGPTSA